jgi:hypothetical protein
MRKWIAKFDQIRPHKSFELHQLVSGKIRLHPLGNTEQKGVGLLLRFVHSVPPSERLRKSLQDRPDENRVAVSHHFPISQDCGISGLEESPRSLLWHHFFH